MALDEMDSGPFAGLGANEAKTAYSAIPIDEDSDGQTPPHDIQGHQSRYHTRLLLDTWFPEILAVAFSTGCLIAIVAVLLAYNDKTVPQLPYGITLNAIVSILATASRSSLIYTVATSISQLKWCWF